MACLRTRWVNAMFPKPVLDYIKDNASRFVDVPPGAGDTMTSSNQENSLENRWLPPMQHPIIWAHQNERRDWKCLYYSTALVMHYLGDTYGAAVMKEQGDTLCVILYDSFLSLMKCLGYVNSIV
eukprot:scaffold26714_cov74-Attheya_sp.AAC.3